MDAEIIRRATVYIIPIIFAITAHEAAHGYMARFFGDQTAYAAGRISLNPFRHIDLIGAVLVPILSLILGGMVFGWAKPVPVDPRQMRNPRRDMMLVAAAGPLANLVMAIMWTFCASILHYFEVTDGFASMVCIAGLQFNLMLMIFNLLPIPPLDGGTILMCILPDRYAYLLAQLRGYGLIIVLLLLMFGVLQPIVQFGMKLFGEPIVHFFF